MSELPNVRETLIILCFLDWRDLRRVQEDTLIVSKNFHFLRNTLLFLMFFINIFPPGLLGSDVLQSQLALLHRLIVERIILLEHLLLNFNIYCLWCRKEHARKILFVVIQEVDSDRFHQFIPQFAHLFLLLHIIYLNCSQSFLDTGYSLPLLAFYPMTFAFHCSLTRKIGMSIIMNCPS